MKSIIASSLLLLIPLVAAQLRPEDFNDVNFVDYQEDSRPECVNGIRFSFSPEPWTSLGFDISGNLTYPKPSELGDYKEVDCSVAATIEYPHNKYEFSVEKSILTFQADIESGLTLEGAVAFWFSDSFGGYTYPVSLAGPHEGKYVSTTPVYSTVSANSARTTFNLRLKLKFNGKKKANAKLIGGFYGRKKYESFLVFPLKWTRK